MPKLSEILTTLAIFGLVFTLVFAIKKMAFPEGFVAANGGNAARYAIFVFFTVIVTQVIATEIVELCHKIKEAHPEPESEKKRYKNLIFLLITTIVTIAGYWVIDNPQVFGPAPAAVPSDEGKKEPTHH